MSAPSNAKPRKPLIESIWFWAFVFSAAALGALMIMGPRFGERQAQIEQNYQARVRANQQALGQEFDSKISQPDDTQINLTPLYLGFGALFACSWAMVWWHYFRPAIWRRQPNLPPSPSTETEPPGA